MIMFIHQNTTNGNGERKLCYLAYPFLQETEKVCMFRMNFGRSNKNIFYSHVDILVLRPAWAPIKLQFGVGTRTAAQVASG